MSREYRSMVGGIRVREPLDSELHALRVDLRRSQSAEVDVVLPGEFAVQVLRDQRAAEYTITLRCSVVSGILLEGIWRRNFVVDYAFEAPSSNQRILRIKCSPGCDLRIECGGIAVARVTPVAPAA
jgi:hypothetical protein